MPIQMTPEQEAVARALFDPEPDKREGKTRLTVRFNSTTLKISKASGNRWALKGAVVLRYVEEPATTPTGGRYTRRALTVRTSDGRRWFGTLKNGTDVVKLRLAPSTDSE